MMARRVPTVVSVAAICALLIVLLYSSAQTVFAGDGGVGSGGSAGSGGSGGYTYYGHGWARYRLGSGGPTRGFHSGQWDTVVDACSGSYSSAMVHILGTGSGTGSGADGSYKGYDYHSVIYRYPGAWGNGGQVDHNRATKVATPTAKRAYDLLPAHLKHGFTWGENVGWFCYGHVPSSWGPMVAGSVATDVNKKTISSIAAGQTIYWVHEVKNDGRAGTTTTPIITGDIIWGGDKSVNNKIETENAYSQHFARDSHIIKERGLPTTSSDINKRYCQRITGDHYSSKYPKKSFSSDAACVLVVAPPHVTPSTSISPNPVGVGQTYTAKATLTNSTGLAGSVTATWRTWLDDGNQNYDTTGVDALNGPQDGPWMVTVPANGSFTFGPRSGIADGTHAYACTEIYNVTGQSGTTVTTPSSKTCAKIVVRPYFSVLGGDVAAGASFGARGVANAKAGIIGTNNDGTSDYHGAAAQLAALALGKITSFVTGQSQNGGVGPTWTSSIDSGAAPTILGFANTSPPVGGTTYGGAFNLPNWAVQDYYNDTTTGVTPFTGFSAGNYFYHGKLTLNGNPITADGRKIVLKVDGDVYINSDIIYGTAGRLDHIPQFELIVSGNIYVDHSVRKLDGFYAAQGNGTTTGKFVSCSDSTRALYGISNIATCNQPLTVNGAVAAQKVILNRTYGDIYGGSVPQEPSETIRFSPLLWMPSATSSLGGGSWQSVTSLPPIL